MNTAVRMPSCSDSEDDPDYIPENDGGRMFMTLNAKHPRSTWLGSPGASDNERDSKRRRTEADMNAVAEDEATRKQCVQLSTSVLRSGSRP